MGGRALQGSPLVLESEGSSHVGFRSFSFPLAVVARVAQLDGGEHVDDRCLRSCLYLLEYFLSYPTDKFARQERDWFLEA